MQISDTPGKKAYDEMTILSKIFLLLQTIGRVHDSKIINGSFHLHKSLYLGRTKPLPIINILTKSIKILIHLYLFRTERIHTNNIFMRFTLEMDQILIVPKPICVRTKEKALIVDRAGKFGMNFTEYRVGPQSTGIH